MNVMTSNKVGRVTQVTGAVVDVQFEDHLPEIMNALETDNNDFKLAAEITLKVAGADKAKVQALLEDAHTICPYSKATRGNSPVTLTAL